MDKNNVLDDIFSNVNSWVTFAEQKNTIIISLFSLIAFATLFGNDLLGLTGTMKVSIIILWLLFVLALIITLISFFPRTKIFAKGKDKKLYKTDNLFFYGHIYKYSYSELEKAYKARYGVNIDNAINKDLINQILNNSEIALFKFNCFKLSSVCIGLALIQFAFFYIKSLI